MQEKLENGIMGPQKILFTTDDEFIKQKAEQLNKSSTNNFRTVRCRGLISISFVLAVLGANDYYCIEGFQQEKPNGFEILLGFSKNSAAICFLDKGPAIEMMEVLSAPVTISTLMHLIFLIVQNFFTEADSSRVLQELQSRITTAKTTGFTYFAC